MSQHDNQAKPKQTVREAQEALKQSQQQPQPNQATPPHTGKPPKE